MVSVPTSVMVAQPHGRGCDIDHIQGFLKLCLSVRSMDCKGLDPPRGASSAHSGRKSFGLEWAGTDWSRPAN